MEEQRIKIEQLRWMYAGLAGICLAFFLALFGSGISLSKSPWIIGATICFSISLPLFTAFTIAHIILIESNFTPTMYEPVLKSIRIKIITYIAVISFYIGFLLMISYISLLISALILLVSIYSYIELRRFFNNVYKQNTL